jgi:hypothetical protein
VVHEDILFQWTLDMGASLNKAQAYELSKVISAVAYANIHQCEVLVLAWISGCCSWQAPPKKEISSHEMTFKEEQAGSYRAVLDTQPRSSRREIMACPIRIMYLQNNKRWSMQCIDFRSQMIW